MLLNNFQMVWLKKKKNRKMGYSLTIRVRRPTHRTTCAARVTPRGLTSPDVDSSNTAANIPDLAIATQTQTTVEGIVVKQFVFKPEKK